MKLTKKDFFDGQEMTEREKRIYEKGKKDADSDFWFYIGMVASAVIILVEYLIVTKKH